jgi:hypothetical protein
MLVAAGRFSFSPRMDYSLSDNIFWDSSAIDDRVLTPGLGLNLALGQFDLFIDASGKSYDSNDYLNHASISAGCDYSGMVSRRGVVFISPGFDLTRFNGDMAYLNRSVPSLVVGWKHAFSDRAHGQLGIDARFSDFTSEDSFDHWRLSLFAEFSAFFATQTTLRFSVGLNYLYFPHVAADAVSPEAGAFRASPAETSMAAAVRRRRGPDSPYPPDGRDPGQYAAEDLSWPQPQVSLRVAQGLGYRTGLVAEVAYRQNRALGPNFDALAVDEWALQQADEDFFWQGTRLSLALKTEALLGIELAAEISYLEKSYEGLYALDAQNEPLMPLASRRDQLLLFSLKIERTFGRFGIFLSGAIRRNRSNDLYFQYDSHSIAMGVDYVL